MRTILDFEGERHDLGGMSLKLTARQYQVFNALEDKFASSALIANRAGIHTISKSETAAKFCIQLVKLGLAEKGGTRAFPTWRRAPLSREPTKS